VGTGTLLRRLAGHDADVVGVVFAAVGKTLLSVANDGTVREWHVHASEEDLLNWTRANRYATDLTCEQRILFQTETQCNVSELLPASVR
jgi:hypothetical protein